LEYELLLIKLNISFANLYPIIIISV
jgi:hypothetical protein